MNELDILANLDPAELTRDHKALEALIAMYRQQRAEGKKPKKEQGPVTPLADLLNKNVEKPKVPVGTITRRL